MLVYVCVCRHRVVYLLLATAIDLSSQHNVCDPTISIENFGTEIRFVVTMLFTTLNLVGLATESAFFDYTLTTGLTCIIFACACIPFAVFVSKSPELMEIVLAYVCIKRFSLSLAHDTDV